MMASPAAGRPALRPGQRRRIPRPARADRGDRRATKPEPPPARTTTRRESPMAVLVGKQAPRAVLVGKQAADCTAQAVMPEGSFKQIKLSEYRGKYVILFFYPLDFTFVCPSEIIAFDNHLGEFKERGCEVLGVSIDSHFT